MLQPRIVSWALLLGTLAVLAPVRMGAFLADALDPSDPLAGWLVIAGLVTIVTLFVLHVAIALPGALPSGGRHVLIAQAVLTFAPYLVLGRTWGPIAGLLAASTLLTMERARAWVTFASVVTFDAALRTWGPWGIARAGQMAPAEATHADIASIDPWLAFSGRSLAILIFGVLLFGLTRLAQLAQELHNAREELAATEVARYRRRVEGGLRAAVGEHLDAIVDGARGARGESIAKKRGALRDIATRGRQAMAAVRLGTDPDPLEATTGRSGHDASVADIGSPATDTSVAAPTLDPERISALAERVLLMTILAYCLSFLVNLAGERTSGSSSWALATTAALLAAVFGLRHLRPDRGSGPPKALPLTLPLQLLATLAAWTEFQLEALPLMGLAVGAVLVRLRLPWALLVIATGMTTLPAIGPMAEGTAGWHLYRTAMILLSAAALYALHRIPAIAQHLQATRQDAVRLAVALDRSRVGRDVHDLLGFGLSAITLRSEVLARQLERTPEASDEMFEALIAQADAARNDLRSLTTDDAELDLARELAGADALLEAAGIARGLRIDDVHLPPPVDALFAVVVREAVTNIVRHASASKADIIVSVVRREARLVVRNDGGRNPAGEKAERGPERHGRGIDNLTARTSTLGGHLTSGTDGNGCFELTVCVPITT